MAKFITIVLPPNSKPCIHGNCATRRVEAESPREAAEKRLKAEAARKGERLVGSSEDTTVLVVDIDGCFTSAFKSVLVSRPAYEIVEA